MLLTAREAAALLGTTERAVYQQVDEGEIPCQRMRDQLGFNRTDLLEWATSRGLRVHLEQFDDAVDRSRRIPRLGAALRAGGVHLDVPAATRDEALREIVARVPDRAGLDRAFVTAVLAAREWPFSTMPGDGIAVPPVRHPIVAPGTSAVVTVTHFRSPVPIAQGDPVSVAVLIVSPTVRAHLQMLARVAHALHDPGFHATVVGRRSTEDLAAHADRLEGPGGAPVTGEAR